MLPTDVGGLSFAAMVCSVKFVGGRPVSPIWQGVEVDDIGQTAHLPHVQRIRGRQGCLYCQKSEEERLRALRGRGGAEDDGGCRQRWLLGTCRVLSADYTQSHTTIDFDYQLYTLYALVQIIKRPGEYSNILRQHRCRGCRALSNTPMRAGPLSSQPADDEPRWNFESSSDFAKLMKSVRLAKITSSRKCFTSPCKLACA